MSIIAIDNKRLNEKTLINLALWAMQLVSAALFFSAGGPKLMGAEQAVQGFNALGLGQWFRYFTGAIEVISAVLLLFPKTAGLGALLLIPTMIGAIIAHLTVFGGSWAMAGSLLVTSILIAYGRRERTMALFSKQR